MAYVVVLDELGAAAYADVEAAEHAFAFYGHVGVFALSVFDVDVEAFAFEEQLEVGIML